MIWVLLGALIVTAIVGGGGEGDIEIRFPAHDRVEEAIEDEERRDQVDALFTGAEDNAVERVHAQLEALGRLREVSATRSSTRADIDQLTAGMEMESAQRRFVDLRFRLRNTVTRDEWGRLFPPPDAE